MKTVMIYVVLIILFALSIVCTFLGFYIPVKCSQNCAICSETFKTIYPFVLLIIVIGAISMIFYLVISFFQLEKTKIETQVKLQIAQEETKREQNNHNFHIRKEENFTHEHFLQLIEKSKKEDTIDFGILKELISFYVGFRKN
ncbi:MAG: hypothetical protein GX437_05530 [Sphingobacteriales bacterium]|nr:hypothetical protein [Sphingobacteriales bacterium]